MNLRDQATLLQLDLLAVDVDAALTAAAVPHAMLKGPSTTAWLYPEGRSYSDVDVLVASDEVARAVRALTAIAVADSGRAGEQADHSLLLHSTHGLEVDLHRSLPGVPVSRRVWLVLAGHVVDLQLDVGTVAALDEPARCLVLALHAAQSGPAERQPAEDVRRALGAAKPSSWDWATSAAAELGVADVFAVGLIRGGADPDTPQSRRGALLLAGAPAPALGLERLLALPWSERWPMLRSELFPSREFLLRAYPQLVHRRFGVPRAHLRRWRTLARDVPAAVRSWRRATRS